MSGGLWTLSTALGLLALYVLSVVVRGYLLWRRRWPGWRVVVDAARRG